MKIFYLLISFVLYSCASNNTKSINDSVTEYKINNTPLSEFNPNDYRSWDNMRAGILTVRDEIMSKYFIEISPDSETSGIINLKIVIMPNGIVRGVSVLQNTLGNTEIEKYVLEKVKSIDFGPSDVKETTITYRFNFDREKYNQ